MLNSNGNLECQITLEIRSWIFIVIQTIFCVNHILLECNNFENFKNEWCINVNALADGKKLRTYK
jgi:hypothetical protein